jgi:4-hydroxy-tetrahydrodipicolinate reductase
MALKIALVGYGKMGHEIEQMALQRGHSVVARIGREGIAQHDLSTVDVAIEFTHPGSALENVQGLLEAGIATVCGTTGWYRHLPSLEALAQHTALVYASNFSLGVNIAFEVNRHLAQLMAEHPSYVPTIEEVHHTAKKDAPSGTAITLAEGILGADHHRTEWVLAPKTKDHHLEITSVRKDPVPGTHTVSYTSDIDTLSLTHVAHSRAGFALGAVIAAERIMDLGSGIHAFSSLIFQKKK